MTIPARTSPGSLGSNVALGAAASHEFEDSRPPPNASKVMWYLRSTQIFTWVIERSYDGGGAFDVFRTLTTADLANPESPVMLDGPPGFGENGAPVIFRHTVTNDGAAAANVQLTQAWER